MNAEFINVEQSTDAWLKMRLGVITASCAHDLIPTISEKEAVYSKKDPSKMLHPASKTIKFKQARQTYMNELIAEVCTGKGEELSAKPLEWGRTNEAAAKAAYSFEANEVVLDGGFIYGMDKRVGASPDGIIKGKNKGLELKCPYSSKTHIDFIINGEIKDEYLTQCQWSMWVSGFDQWAFASFDPRMKTKMIHYQIIERDPATMALFDEIVPQFIHEMDEYLAKIGVVFGSQF